MEFQHLGEGNTGYYQNSHTLDIENSTQSHYQKLNVKVISVDDNQYDQLSPGNIEETQSNNGYLQLPEVNKENVESSYDYLKLYGSVKTNQCPDIASIELSDLPNGKNVDIENKPSDKSKQDSVALDSIRLNEDIYFEINDTDQPNLNQVYQGSENHLDVSQTLRTNNDATNTERSKKSVSKRTCLTWKHKCMLSVIVVGITVIMAVGTVIYILVNKESEKEIQNHVSCTHVLDARLYFGPIEMLCTIPTSEKFEYVGFYYGTRLDNSLYGVVLNRNGTIFQTHKTNSDIYVSLIEITSQYMLVITFSNVSCVMDGVYRLALMRQLVGAPEEYKGTNGYLKVKHFCTTLEPLTTTPLSSMFISCTDVSVLINSGAAVMTCSLHNTATFTMINVTFTKKGDSDVQQIAIIWPSNTIVMLAMQKSVNISFVNYIINMTILNPSCENEGTFSIVTNINSVSVEDQGTITVQYFPGKPVLKLSVDQVIDLDFYRDTGVHSCSGNIGNPTRELILEILYVNTYEYKEIPGSILKDLQRNKSTTECQNYEQIQFGLLFSSEMKNSKIRCRPSGNVNNETIAEESLALIPRDICLCGDIGSYRGHPGRCDVHVLCLAANSIMYPYGRACLDSQCRNSLTGTCSTDCSDAICNEDVPTDFCTTTTIPTTTPVPPKPSVEVLCNGSSIAINTGPVDVVCYFNETTYEYINISFTMHNESIPRPVAKIQAGGNVVVIDQTSNRIIEIDVNVIKIKTLIASCDSGGIYRVTIDTGGTPVSSKGSLEILTKPDKPSIDQQIHIIDGKTVKYTCTGKVGHPPGSIEFLVRKNGKENFTVSSIASTSSEVTPNDNCNNQQAFYHEQIVTSDWNKTTIKCRAVNQRTITENDDMNFYTSDEKEIISIAADYCSIQGTTYRYHPRGCGYYVWCISSMIYTQKCPTATCFSFGDEQPCVLCSQAPPPCNDTSSD